MKDVRNARNQESCRGNKELSGTDFDKHWKDTAAMLENHGFDMTLVDGLKGGDAYFDYLFKDIIISILGR